MLHPDAASFQPRLQPGDIVTGLEGIPSGPVDIAYQALQNMCRLRHGDGRPLDQAAIDALTTPEQRAFPISLIQTVSIFVDHEPETGMPVTLSEEQVDQRLNLAGNYREGPLRLFQKVHDRAAAYRRNLDEETGIRRTYVDPSELLKSVLRKKI